MIGKAITIRSTRIIRARLLRGLRWLGRPEHRITAAADPESNLRVLLVALVVTLSLPLLLILLVIAAVQQAELPYIVVLASTIMVLGASFLHLHRTGDHRRTAVVITTVVLLFLLFLVVDGEGSGAGTGLLWFYLFPPLPMLLFGLKRGLLLDSVVVLALGLMLTYGKSVLGSPYEPTLVSRFLGSMGAMVALSAVYEYARVRALEEMRRSQRKLERMSRTDDLTGLPNRRDLHQRLREEALRYARSGKSFSILIADLDFFKRINDTLGHLCGDVALRRASAAMRKGLRNQDVIGRWGGEEFLFILPETPLEGAAKVAENLRALVEALPMEWRGKSFHMTVSIGVAAHFGSRIEETIREADRCLYEAKNAGRNRVAFGKKAVSSATALA